MQIGLSGISGPSAKRSKNSPTFYGQMCTRNMARHIGLSNGSNITAVHRRKRGHSINCRLITTNSYRRPVRKENDLGSVLQSVSKMDGNGSALLDL